MEHELTKGPVMKTMLLFAIPMILGDLLQQCYNIADTLIVGRFLGADALAAVGSAFALMTFLTSILLGLAMGSGLLHPLRKKRYDRLKRMYPCFFCAAGSDQSDPEPSDLHRNRWHHLVFAYSGRIKRTDA